METKPPKLRVVDNPVFRFTAREIEWIDAPILQQKIYEEECRSILSKNDSPDVGFTYSVNAYRGCFHGCAYCYARPSHQYLEFGAGTDFEKNLVVKVNSATRLREAFAKRSWKREEIVFSGNTDCYQPIELRYELTRKCLEACAEFRNPVAIITKGAIIERDIDLLLALKKRASIFVYMSIASADDEISKLMEPGAPRPSRRFRAMRALTQAGIPVGIGIAPIIPGLTDTHIPELLHRAKEAGASRSFMTLLRLPAEVREIFLARLDEAFPSRKDKIIRALQRMKGGRLNRTEFGRRMVGEGEEWQAIKWMFDTTVAKLGLNSRRPRQVEKEQLPAQRSFW
jgi:DNA repair photolyase